MRPPQRGEVWLVDLGLAAKVRPALVFCPPPSDEDRTVMTIVPHTTAARGSRFEVTGAVPFLKAGAFDALGLVTIPTAKFLRDLGSLKSKQLVDIEVAVCRWLGLPQGPTP